MKKMGVGVGCGGCRNRWDTERFWRMQSFLEQQGPSCVKCTGTQCCNMVCISVAHSTYPLEHSGGGGGGAEGGRGRRFESTARSAEGSVKVAEDHPVWPSGKASGW